MAFASLPPSPVFFFFNVNLRIIKRLGERLNVVASFLFLDLFSEGDIFKCTSIKKCI